MRSLEEIKEFAKTLPALPIQWEIADKMTDKQVVSLKYKMVSERHKLENEFSILAEDIMLHGDNEEIDQKAFDLSVSLLETYAIQDLVERLIAIRMLGVK